MNWFRFWILVGVVAFCAAVWWGFTCMGDATACGPARTVQVEHET